MHKHAIVVLVCMAASVGAALADDLRPPPWRGNYSTTSQVWAFATDANPTDPDGPAAGGQPPLAGTTLHVLNSEHMANEWGRDGVWVLGTDPAGVMEVTVANHEPPNTYKFVRIQLTWATWDPPSLPTITGTDPQGHPDPTLVETIPVGPAGQGWQVSVYDWTLSPNPVSETFEISGPIMIDQLVVDTWCIPEPASLSLLAVGALAALRRRRR